MLQYQDNSRLIWPMVRFAGLIYHSTVRAIRKSSANPLTGLLTAVLQSVMLIIVFYIMLNLFGLRRNAVRGDYLIYLMTGIFLFLTHTKTMAKVVGSEGPASPIMKHAPMTPFVAVTAAALSVLYIQPLSAGVILFVTHVAIRPVEIDNWPGVFFSYFMAWLSGIAVGLIFLSIKTYAPGVAAIGATIWSRANMVASGKMFVANQLPAYLLPYFTWNPLFHTIDQARGAAFINYNPHVTSALYPLWFSLAVMVIGMMAEFFTRQFASISMASRR